MRLLRALAGPLAIAVWLLSAAPADAQNGTPSDEWRGELTLYGWVPGMKASYRTFGNAPESDTHISIFDILDGAFMASGSLTYDRFGLLADFIWVSLEDDGANPSGLFTRASTDVDVYVGTLAGTVALARQSNVRFDVLGGARIIHADVENRFRVGGLPELRTGRSRTWVDPIFGARMHVDLSDDWFARFHGDAGGFGVGSDLSLQAVAMLGYRFNDWLDGKLGYRYLGVDFEDSGFLFDAEFYGPFIALSLTF